MKKRGFTLIELLVVIGIIALLVSILMPALGRARELANQVKDASQINGILKSVAMYEDDNRGMAPSAGAADGNISKFAPAGWYVNTQGRWVNPNVPWGKKLDPANPLAGTVGASLYLLVKYTDLVPAMFVDPSTDDVPMSLAEAIAAAGSGVTIETWADLMDFHTMRNLSYSYHDPWVNAINDSSSGSLAVLACKNNAYDDSAHGKYDGTANEDAGATPVTNADNDADAGLPSWNPDWTDANGTNLRHGNSNNHKTELQNVGFADTHVKKYHTPDVGISKDNIYTRWWGTPGNINTTQRSKLVGAWDVSSAWNHSMHRNDSYLGD